MQIRKWVSKVHLLVIWFVALEVLLKGILRSFYLVVVWLSVVIEVVELMQICFQIGEIKHVLELVSTKRRLVGMEGTGGVDSIAIQKSGWVSEQIEWIAPLLLGLAVVGQLAPEGERVDVVQIGKTSHAWWPWYVRLWCNLVGTGLLRNEIWLRTGEGCLVVLQDLGLESFDLLATCAHVVGVYAEMVLAFAQVLGLLQRQKLIGIFMRGWRKLFQFDILEQVTLEVNCISVEVGLVAI